MKLCGLQKTTLLDYPGHLAATIFTGGCNFNCPYCHNQDLIKPREFISTEWVLNFLEKRKAILEGVCITGGEPTLQKDLPQFLKKIKDYGYLVKLDTNGYHPQVVKALYREGLIDYAAMDVKTSPGKYPQLTGLKAMELERINETITFLVECGIRHEFRTTVVRELHTFADIAEIAAWVQGCQSYYLQSYQDAPSLEPGSYHPYHEDELRSLVNQLKPSISQISLRGL